MPLPTSYTEADLATLMHTTLGATATALGYAAPSGGSTGVYAEAVYDALIAYGVSDIASATDVPKIRAAAAVAAWRKATNDATAKIQFGGDGQSFADQQVYDHAVRQMAAAEVALMALGGGVAVGVTKLRFKHDPYNNSFSETDRTL